MELKTARLTILIDPAKKQAFEELCRSQDMTPSQVVRRLIRDFMEEQQAQPPASRRATAKAPTRKASPARKSPTPRKTR
jgi:predicted transcriptional regulator